MLTSCATGSSAQVTAQSQSLTLLVRAWGCHPAWARDCSRHTGGFSVDPSGDVAGIYLDTNLAYHGFVRYSDGQFANFDAPSAGTSTLQGTGIFSIGATGEIAGTYVDASFVAHGYVLAH